MPAPGVRALVVLAATTVIGYLIGVIGFEDGAARWIKVARHAVLVGVVGSAFWSWAVYKVVFFNDSDLGAISFALVLAASAYGVRTATTAPVEDNIKETVRAYKVRERLARVQLRARVRTSKTLMVSATATVAINYAWILYTVDFLPPSFQFYLALGAGYWACAGLIGFRLAQGWEQFLFLTVDDSDSERTGLSEKA